MAGGSARRQRLVGARLGLLAVAVAGLAGCAGDEALARDVRPGMTRTEVLQTLYEVTRRDGCPRAGGETGTDYAYTDLFWFGEPMALNAPVVAVSYDWAPERRTWVVSAVEAARTPGLSDALAACAAAK